MKNKKIFYILISFVVLMLLVIFIPLCRYKMSSDLITVSNMSANNGKLELTIMNNNEKGYYKKTITRKRGDTVYIYVIGTSFKFLGDVKDTHNIKVDIKEVSKIYIKGRGNETLIYEVKDI